MNLSAKNIFYVLSLPLLLTNITTLTMDKPEAPQTSFEEQWKILKQIENDTHIFTILRACKPYGLSTKACITTKTSQANKAMQPWEPHLDTPHRRHSTWNTIALKFSDNGTKSLFAQYDKDDSDGSKPDIVVTEFDLNTQKVQNYFIEGEVGKNW